MSRIADCKLIEIAGKKDVRGSLNAIHFNGNILPFKPLRLFYITNVPILCTRGNHAHKFCDQYLISLSGSIRIDLNDGTNENHITLSNPDVGIYIPAGIWASQTFLSYGAILAVLASHEYNQSDYICDLSYFKKLKND